MNDKAKQQKFGRASVLAGGLGIFMAVAAATGVSAMPVDPDSYTDIPGVDEDGRLDIREVLDNSTQMDIRLTKQIMLLQRQINQLQRKIDKLEAEVE